jgi:hypothetical protein
MNQKKLASWLKGIILGAGLCGLAVCLYVIPFWGKDIVSNMPEFSYCFLPWLIFIPQYESSRDNSSFDDCLLRGARSCSYFCRIVAPC